MLRLLLILNFILCLWAKNEDGLSEGDSDFGANLVTSLRNDANLDVSTDEEYEDLRAELLAYHTALASLTSLDSSKSRRSMVTTPCWALGGICIDHKLCTGLRSLSQIPGCKDKLKVCCFAWNRFKVRDFRDKGIESLAMPWSLKREFGGRGILDVEKGGKKKKQNKNKNDANQKSALAVIIKTNK